MFVSRAKFASFFVSTCLVFLILSNQRLLKCCCLIMLLPCFGMDLLLTYGFGLLDFVQPGVVGRFWWHIYGDRHFISFGDMCILPSNPCYSPCMITFILCSPVILFIFEFVPCSAWFFD